MNYKELHAITEQCESLEMVIEEITSDTPRADFFQYYNQLLEYPYTRKIEFKSAEAKEHIMAAVKAELRAKTAELKDFISGAE